PVAFIQTTTVQSIFAEDSNRCLQIFCDETHEQTRRVMVALAERYEASAEPNVDEIISRHHKFQLSLKKCRVVIPFASKVAKMMPAGRVEARRGIGMVIGTIETVALLHQHARERDSHGNLEATAADYEVARQALL